MNMKYRRNTPPDSRPIIKIKFILKNNAIEMEPPWKQLKKILKILVKRARDGTQNLTRWGFHHLAVLHFRMLKRHTIHYI